MASPDPKKYQPKSFKVLNTGQQLCSIRFNGEGKLLAAGSFEGSIRRWDFSTDKFEELPAIKGHDGWVQRVAWHGDSKRLFSADTWGRLSAWPATEKEPKALWSIADAHDGWIHDLALSPDGTKLASAGRDRTVRISATSDGKKEAVFEHPDIILSVAFHPEGKSIVTGDLKGVVRQWDLASRKSVREFDAKQMYLHDRLQDVGGVRCFTFNGDGSRMIAGGAVPKTGGFVTATNLILAFDWKSGKLVHTFKGAADTEGYVNDLAIHPDGFLMAVSSGQPGNGRLFFWQMDEAQAFITMPLPNCHSLAFHPNGSRIVVSATNANSAGNGRPKGKGNDDYPGNYSPLHVLDLPKVKT